MPDQAYDLGETKSEKRCFLKTRRRLRKAEGDAIAARETAMTADFINKVPPDDLPVIVTFLTGRIFPEWEQRKTGIASQSMIKIIATTPTIARRW